MTNYLKMASIDTCEQTLENWSKMVPKKYVIKKATHKKINPALYQRIPFDFDFAPVMLKPSPIHGKGVFATRDILTNEVVTMYPGDYVFIAHKSNNSKIRLTSPICKSMFGFLTKQQYNTALYPYSLHVNDMVSIVGHPRLVGDPSYLGHMINDAAKPTSSVASHKVYETVSQAKANCEFYNFKGDMHIGIIATRDIAQGEELFVHYELSYWTSL